MARTDHRARVKRNEAAPSGVADDASEAKEEAIPAGAAPRWSTEALDDHGVGHAAPLAHDLQAPTAVGALELVHERGGESGAGAAERVAEGDRAAVHVDLDHVGVVLLLPCEHHRR